MRRLPWLPCSFALLVAACGRAPAPELRIGINPWPGYEYFYLAQELGLFDTTAVRVRVVELSSLSDTRRAFERGQLDAFAGTPIEVLKARESSSRRPVLMLATDVSEGADVVLARPGIADLRALAGRRIGVEPGTLNVYLVSRALEQVGLTLGDVVLVSLEPQQMPGALSRGTVDAVASYPPAALAMAALPGVTTLFSSAELPDEILGVASVDSAYLAAHRGAVVALLRGFEAARAHAAAHPEEADARMAARERITPAAFRIARSQGIRLLPLADQARYLGATGRVASALRHADEVLLAVGELHTSQAGAGLLAPEVARAAQAPGGSGTAP